MEIKIGVGIEKVQFGMSIDTVENILGIPDKTEKNEYNLLLQYNSLRCTLWFNADSLLHWIECSHPDAALFNQAVIGKAAQPMLEQIKSELSELWEVEDYGSMQSYRFQDAEIELQVEYATITTICFGHLWKDDEPLYPD